MSQTPVNLPSLQEPYSVEVPNSETTLRTTNVVTPTTPTYTTSFTRSTAVRDNFQMTEPVHTPLVIDVEQISDDPALSPLEAGSSLIPVPNGMASSSRRASNSNPASTSEVICIDPDSPPRSLMARPESNGRKVRRLNDSTPVIIVDDDDEAKQQPAGGSLEDVKPEPTARVGERRRLSRANSNSSIRPVTSRNSRSNATSSRTNTLHNPHTSGTITDESPPSRDLPYTPETPVVTRTRDMPPLAARQFRHAPLGGSRLTSTRRRQGAGSSHGVVAGSGSSAPGSRIQQVQLVLRFVGSNSQQVGVSYVARGGGSRRSRNTASGIRAHGLAQVHAHQHHHTHPRSSHLGQDFLQQIARSVDDGRLIEFRYFTDGGLPDYEALLSLDEQLLRQRNAAPKSIIENLPEIVASTADKEVRCVICMCDVEEGEKLRKLPCTHKYHKTCIDEWLTYNGCCPVDKQRICPVRSVGNSANPWPSRFRPASASAARFHSSRGGSSRSAAGRSRTTHPNGQS